MKYSNSLLKRVTRRSFLRFVAVSASLTALGLGAQCGSTPTPRVIEKVITQIVEKPVEKVVTQVVEKPVEVTRIVEKVLEPTPAPEPPPEPPERVLFVGDQWLTYNDGLGNHLRMLAASASPPLTIETKSLTASQGSRGLLASHLKFSSIGDKVREHGWEVVVLQESQTFSVDFEEFFHEAARQLDAEIREAGARIAFYMLPGWMGSLPNLTNENQVKVYGKIGRELGATVAPVALAWQRSLSETPALHLQVGGVPHPVNHTIHATYLAACVFYATLLGLNPVGLPYAPEEITDEEREFLQRMAWETVQEYEQPAQALRTS
jgi:hypothetical protein